MTAAAIRVDLIPNLKNPENPVPALDPNNPPKTKGGGG